MLRCLRIPCRTGRLRRVLKYVALHSNVHIEVSGLVNHHFYRNSDCEGEAAVFLFQRHLFALNLSDFPETQASRREGKKEWARAPHLQNSVVDQHDDTVETRQHTHKHFVCHDTPKHLV
jgi:hypothetical protein